MSNKLLSVILLLAMAFSMCACRADMTSAGSATQPTNEQPKAIQIIAPVDIYEGKVSADSNINLTVQEGYKLIQDMNSDDYPYRRYYEYMSNALCQIDIVPVVLEAELQNKTMTYTARTNFSGFFKDVVQYIGKEVIDSTYFGWRGQREMPTGTEDTQRPEHIWVDILIKSDARVVGFAVLEIVDWHADCYWKEQGCYTIQDRYTEYYPLIDGQFQEIDEAFVWQRIEQYHKYAES